MSSFGDQHLDHGRVGIACDTGLRNLPPEQCYSDRNQIRALLREAMIQGGLGQRDPAVPLADIIQPGASVLLKPNWVYHRNQGPHDSVSLVTHPVFLLEVLAEVIAARPGKVIMGDAPLQGCDWQKLVTPEFHENVRRVSTESGVAIELVDFRRTVTKTDDLGDGVDVDQRDLDRFVLFDLGTDSWLEPISEPRGRFRVTSYDPRELARTHCPGRHQYLLCKELFEADVIIQLPKLKTHSKAGITGAIKNSVGLNGNKDYLPHHRIGGSDHGGDCYQGRDVNMRAAEWLLDAANRKVGTAAYGAIRKLAAIQSRLIRNSPIGGLEGAWHGNDTCWRMVLDLNRVLLYGTASGNLSDTAQRTIYSLTDAIVCGQGDGPLKPRPLVVGVVSFAASSVAAEWVHCLLLGLDPDRIALVRESFTQTRWPLIDANADVHPMIDSQRASAEQIRQAIGVRAAPASGWVGQIEMEPVA